MTRIAGRLESIKSQDWLDAGFTSGEFAEIYRVATTDAYNQGMLTIETAARWKEAGFTVAHMFSYRRAGIHVEDAKIWVEELGPTGSTPSVPISLVRRARESSDSEVRKLQNPRIGGLWGKLPGQGQWNDYTKLLTAIAIKDWLGEEKRDQILALAYRLRITPAGMFEALNKARSDSAKELLKLIKDADEGKLAGVVTLCDDELHEIGNVPVNTLRVALRVL